MTVLPVQDTGTEARTLEQLKKLEGNIERRTNKHVPGLLGRDGHEVFITTCSRRSVRGDSGVCRFTLKGWDNEGNFIKWTGQSDDIEVTQTNLGTLLAADRQQPLILQV
jgi:hypothetical protein